MNRDRLSTRSAFSFVIVAAFVCLALLTSSCGRDEPARPTDLNGGGDENPVHEVYQSSLERDRSPDESGIPDLVEGNHEFTFDLYAHLREQPGNLLFSPLSIRTAFAMVYAGARGETADQMANVLRYGSGDDVYTAFNALDLILHSRNRPANEEYSELELVVSNAFWGRIGLPFKSDYLDLLAVHYGSGIHGLDFAGAPNPSRVVINDWVEEETRDRIQDLLPEGSITSITAAVLTNTLYFKAPWACAFEECETRPGDFRLLDGSTISVPMMWGVVCGSYTEGEGYVAAELAYRDWALAMLILLPDAGGFEAFESSLDAGLLEDIAADLEPTEISAELPRFTFESELRLREVLTGMGMVIPFMHCYPIPCADFSGIIDPSEVNLYIDEAYHKTFIAVDEKGTEAAAATAVVMNPTTGPHPIPVPVTVDRPFLFAIRDVETGAILFFGRVVEPQE